MNSRLAGLSAHQRGPYCTLAAMRTRSPSEPGRGDLADAQCSEARPAPPRQGFISQPASVPSQHGVSPTPTKPGVVRPDITSSRQGVGRRHIGHASRHSNARGRRNHDRLSHTSLQSNQGGNGQVSQFVHDAMFSFIKFFCCFTTLCTGARRRL